MLFSELGFSTFSKHDYHPGFLKDHGKTGYPREFKNDRKSVKSMEAGIKIPECSHESRESALGHAE